MSGCTGCQKQAEDGAEAFTHLLEAWAKPTVFSLGWRRPRPGAFPVEAKHSVSLPSLVCCSCSSAAKGRLLAAQSVALRPLK